MRLFLYLNFTSLVWLFLNIETIKQQYMATYTFNETLKGDTFNGVEFEIHINDTPADISGSKIDCWIRQGSNVGTVRKKLSTTTGGIEIIDPILGQFKIKEFIANLAPDTYYYDIQIKFANGKIKTYISGTWVIAQDITQI